MCHGDAPSEANHEECAKQPIEDGAARDIVTRVSVADRQEHVGHSPAGGYDVPPAVGRIKERPSLLIQGGPEVRHVTDMAYKLLAVR